MMIIFSISAFWSMAVLVYVGLLAKNHQEWSADTRRSLERPALYLQHIHTPTHIRIYEHDLIYIYRTKPKAFRLDR